MNLKKDFVEHPFYEYFNSFVKNEILKIDISNSLQGKYNTLFEDAVYNQCFEIVMFLSIKTLVLDINLFSEKYVNQEQAYTDYIGLIKTKKEIRKFFAKYKILYTQIKLEIRNFTGTAKLFFLRLNCDLDAIKSRLEIKDELSLIEFSKGDSHCGKQSVVKLSFGEQSVYYKPRGYKAIQILSEINELLKKNSICTFALPKTLNISSNYCWQLGIEYHESNSQEAITVYKKYGVLACLAYVFNITDLHMNNMIVNQEDLYLIDVETFFQRDVINSIKEMNLTSELYFKIKNTTLNTGLFPVLFKKIKQVDLSGICGRGNQVVEKGKYKLLNKNRGDMRLVKQPYHIQEGQNRVQIKGDFVDPRDYKREIIFGFELCYRYLMHQQKQIREILSRYDNLETRLIYRNTSDYGKFLLTSTNPKYMSSIDHRNHLFSILYRGTEFLDEVIVKNEINDLLNGDIPYFSVDLLGNIYNSKREKIEKLNEKVNVFIDNRLKTLNCIDLEFQINMLDIVLTKPKKKWEMDSSQNTKFLNDQCCDIDYNKVFDASVALLDDIIENGIENTNEITWIGIDINESEQWVLSPLDLNLYNGLIGNALCFVYAYDLTKNRKYLNVLKKILNTIEQVRDIWDSNDYSVFLGKGGLIYMYYTLWKKLQSLEYKEMFMSAIVEAQQIDLETQKIDFISGISGLLVVLCNIYKREPIKLIYKLIIMISDNIVSKKVVKEFRYVWSSDIDSSEVMNGLSHGLSGIAYSLIKSWEINKTRKYLLVAISAIEFENTRKFEGNWIDFRNYNNRKKKKMYEPVYWCHGAAGIGMVRSKIMGIIENDKIEKDLAMAIDTVINFGAINSDCLCHGKLGNLELLMLEHERTKHSKINADLLEKLCHIISANTNYWASGISQDKKLFTLMLGEAGMSYQLMRFYSGYKVPSVLMLDVPED